MNAYPSRRQFGENVGAGSSFEFENKIHTIPEEVRF